LSFLFCLSRRTKSLKFIGQFVILNKMLCKELFDVSFVLTSFSLLRIYPRVVRKFF